MTAELKHNTDYALNTDLTDTFVYEVDQYNAICHTSSCEKNSCLVNEDSNASSDTPFESIFADDKTRSVFFRLLEHARKTKDAVSFPYRCDTSDTCNFYRLNISISTNRSVLFYNKLLGVDYRPTGVFWNRIPNSTSTAFPVCSICNRIQHAAKWYYFQEMVNLDLWPANDQEMLCSSTICDVCESGINQRIQQSQRKI